MEGPSIQATRTQSNQLRWLLAFPDTSTPHEFPATQGSPEGIITLHDDPSAVADICFVHGLGGDRVGTWTAEGESEPWPKSLLPPQLGKVRVLSYGYSWKVFSDLSRNGQSHRAANNLLIDLTMERIAGNTSSRPLILVALGSGEICKEAVVLSRDNANSHLQGIYMSLKGILFIGAPFQKSTLLGWAGRLASLFGPPRTASDHKLSQRLSKISADDMIPELIQESFNVLIEEQRDRDSHRPILTQSFVPEILASKTELAVSKESATLPGNGPVTINASVEDMVRFKSVHDDGFQKIVNVLQLWISEIEDTRNEQLQTGGSNSDSLQTESLNNSRVSRRPVFVPPSVRAPVQRPPSPLEIADVPTERPSRFMPCYIICSIMALVIIGSGILGIYYTVYFDRMGDGFTAASWIVAIGVMALAGPMGRHYPHCSGWSPATPYYHRIHRASTLPRS